MSIGKSNFENLLDEINRYETIKKYPNFKVVMVNFLRHLKFIGYNFIYTDTTSLYFSSSDHPVLCFDGEGISIEIRKYEISLKIDKLCVCMLIDWDYENYESHKDGVFSADSENPIHILIEFINRYARHII